MVLSILKEAQLASNMSQKDMASLQMVANALGKGSVVDLLESFRPTDDDYRKWLATIVGYAADNNISLRRKTNFEDVAGEMFENDPSPPPYEIQQIVVNKLWSDYQSAKRGAAIDQVAQGQEDEEALQKAAQDFEQNGNFSSNDDESLGDEDLGDDESLEGIDDEGIDDEGIDDEGIDDDEDPYETYKANGGTLDRDSFDEDTAELDDEEFDQYIKCGNETCDHQELDDDIDGLDDLEGDIDGLDDLDDLNGDTDPEIAEIVKRVTNPQPRAQISNEDEETGIKTASPVTKPASTSTFLQSMIAAPRGNIQDAVKQVEQDAIAAWKAHSIPKNPHPKKSMAHAAWERGIKKAARDHFGLVPSMSTSKNKTRKR